MINGILYAMLNWIKKKQRKTLLFGIVEMRICPGWAYYIQHWALDVIQRKMLAIVSNKECVKYEVWIIRDLFDRDTYV